MKAVIIENLSKIYSGGKKAVYNISLTLERGEVFGFLGPNGSGKTTTIKMLNGMLAPSGGNCRVFDIDPFRNPESAQSVNNLIRSLSQEKGMTIFLCTHQLRYAQEICTSYGLINEGALLASGSLEQLRTMVLSGMTVKIKASSFPQKLTHQKVGEQQFEMHVSS